VKAVDGTHFDTIREFALDASFTDDESHLSSPARAGNDPLRRYAKLTSQTSLWPDKVAQRYAVETCEERLESLIEFTCQHAVFLYAALRRGRVEAFHEVKVRLDIAGDLADRYLGGISGQPESAVSSLNGMEIATRAQVVHYFRQVIPRNIEVGGHGIDSIEVPVFERHVHQHAKGVIGLCRQSHGLESLLRASNLNLYHVYMFKSIDQSSGHST
jgi:hypothetical protein